VRYFRQAVAGKAVYARFVSLLVSKVPEYGFFILTTSCPVLLSILSFAVWRFYLTAIGVLFAVCGWRFLRRLLKLAVVKLRVKAFLVEQFRVITAFYNAAVLHDENHVGVLNR